MISSKITKSSGVLCKSCNTIAFAQHQSCACGDVRQITVKGLLFVFADDIVLLDVVEVRHTNGAIVAYTPVAPIHISKSMYIDKQTLKDNIERLVND